MARLDRVTKRRLAGVHSAQAREGNTFQLALTTTLGPVFLDTAKLLGMQPAELFEEMLTDYVARHPLLQPVYADIEEKPSLDTTIDDLDLSIRLTNALDNAGIHTVRALLKTAHADVSDLRNMTPKVFKELLLRVRERGFEWPVEGTGK